MKDVAYLRSLANKVSALSPEERIQFNRMLGDKGTTTPKVQGEVAAPTKSVGSSDTFDRKAYERIARKLGVYGKHGCWKAARPTVYAVLDGRMTEADARKACMALAARNGWALNKG